RTRYSRGWSSDVCTPDLPRRQGRHSPQETPAPQTTAAPTRSPVTPSPTASTVPANSCPSATGGSASTRLRPYSVASEPHTPHTGSEERRVGEGRVRQKNG